MRQVVGALLETRAPSEPQPTLRQLDRLVHRPGPSRRPRPRHRANPTCCPRASSSPAIAPSSICSNAFGDTPGGRIDIHVDFGADVLQLTVRGPAVAAVDQHAALAATQARVAVHHGSLSRLRPAR